MTVARENLLISAHAVTRMTERGVTPDNILTVLNDGTTLAQADEKNRRVSGAVVDGRALHVVWVPEGARVVVITVYWPPEE